MRNLLLLLVAFMLFVPSLFAQTSLMVSGTVLDTNGNPLPQASVMITNGSYNAVGSDTILVNTDINGEFIANYTDNSFSILDRVLIRLLTSFVSGADTTYVMNERVFLAGATGEISNAVLRQVVIRDTVTVAGSVAEAPFSDLPAVSYLINRAYSADSGAYLLSLIDTLNQGNSIFWWPSPASLMLYPSGSLPQDTNLVLKYAPRYDTMFLPTYYGSALLWNDAVSLQSSYSEWIDDSLFRYRYLIADFCQGSGSPCSVIEGYNPGGPAFIPGNVTTGSNKGTEVVPAPGRTIILTTANFTPVTYRTSDADGNFYFNNLAYGSYKMFIDSWGKYTDTVDLVLSGTESAEVNWAEGAHHATGNVTQTSLAVAQATQALRGLQIVPNPVAGPFEIAGLQALPEGAGITVTNMAGQVVATPVKGQPVLDAAKWPAGMYIVTVTSTAGVVNLKLQKQ